MLDSQAPVAFQLAVARHACRILSVLSITVPTSWLALPPVPVPVLLKRSSTTIEQLEDSTVVAAEATITSPPPAEEMVSTCAYFVLFRTNPDLRVFKRWGCLAYVRSEKHQRVRFSQHGEFAAVLGLGGDRYDEWTYEVYLFRTRARVARRDILFCEDVMPFAQGRPSPVVQ
jgi:hypothetical protein